MRLVTYTHNGVEAVGVCVGELIAATEYGSMLELIQDGDAGIVRARTAAELAVSESRTVRPDALLAPIPRPGKMFGVWGNYSSHVGEDPNEVLADQPLLFVKLPNSVIGSGQPIVIPYRDLNVDYEAELAFVIGRTAKGVSAAEALSYVIGYTLANDVSSRAIQAKYDQVALGKGLDGFCPMGPALVLSDEISDPTTLYLETHVNGELRQAESVGSMHFSIAQLIEWISSFVTLDPGDVVLTGTSAGVGMYRNPPVWLQPGDFVTVSDRILGRLENRVIPGHSYEKSWETVRSEVRRAAFSAGSR